MRQSTLLVAALVLSFLAALHARGDAVPASVALTMAGESDCLLLCEDEPNYCEEQGHHDAWSPQGSYADAKVGGGAHSAGNPCWLGACATKHPECEASAASHGINSIRLAISHGNVDGVLEATQIKGPGAAVIDVDRSAIQVLGCGSTIVAHFPVTRKFLRDVLEAE